MRDLVGLGWRPDLATDLLANLGAIDVLEIMAEDYAKDTQARVRALRALAPQTPLTVHGVSLGLAGETPPEDWRLEAMARVVQAAEPLFWSEHLAFVRAGDVEIGHLAAPPRTMASIERCATQVARATRVVGAPPHLENVATLFEPPGSVMSEPAWIAAILARTSGTLLLDLHNLYANAVNFGWDAKAYIDALPAEQIGSLHLSGGQRVSAEGQSRVLDDHRHDVPDPVFDLLSYVAARVEQPLTVILERDGDFPTFAVLQDQLQRARQCLAAGRAQRSHALA